MSSNKNFKYGKRFGSGKKRIQVTLKEKLEFLSDNLSTGQEEWYQLGI